MTEPDGPPRPEEDPDLEDNGLTPYEAEQAELEHLAEMADRYRKRDKGMEL